MRSLAAAVIAACACALAIVSPAAAHSDPPVVIIGTGGVMWEYVTPEDTPNLFAFSERAAVGNVSVRSVYPTSCPADGWLTLGAGERAGDSVSDAGACRLLEEPAQSETGFLVPNWQDYLASAENSPYRATLGQLNDLTRDRDTLALGPGAAIALADDRGRVEDYGDVSDLIDLAPGKDLVLIDLGGLSELEPRQFAQTESRPTGDPLSASFTGQNWNDSDLRERMRELDVRLGTVLDDVEKALPNAHTTIVSLSDYSAIASTLQVVMTESDEPGLVTSATTRREGLIAITDLLPTIVPGAAGPGSPLTVTEGGTAADNRETVTDLDRLTLAIAPATGPVYALWGTMWLLTLTFLRRRGPALDTALLASAAVPAANVAMMATPWYRAPFPTAVLLLGTFAISLVIAGIAFRTRRFGREYPAGTVAAVTVTAFLLPVLLGSTLALNSAFGALPQLGRFYGMTNMMFAISGAASLILAGVIASRVAENRRAALMILLLGAVVILIDGSPWHGADFGGPPVLTIAFAVLAMLVAGWPITVWRAGGILIAAGLVAALFATVDYLRPADERTHLGDFAESVLDGSALTVILRKGSQVLAQWPLILILLSVVVALALWLKKKGAMALFAEKRDDPWLWVGLALVILLVGGMLINDSGVIIVVTGGMVALPLIASLDRADQPAAVSPRRGAPGRR